MGDAWFVVCNLSLCVDLSLEIWPQPSTPCQKCRCDSKAQKKDTQANTFTDTAQQAKKRALDMHTNIATACLESLKVREVNAQSHAYTHI